MKTRFAIECTDQFDLLANPEDTAILRLECINQVLGIQIHNSYRSMCGSVNKRYLTDIVDLPIRFEGARAVITSNFSEHFCSALTNFILRTNSLMNSISIFSISCSTDSLKQLVEMQNVKEMFFHGRIPSAYMSVESIRNISNYSISTMQEAEILRFDAPKFTICSSNLTSSGINTILKEMLNKKRVIKYCLISTDQKLETDDILKGIHNWSTIDIGDREQVLMGSNPAYVIDIYRYQIRITQLQPIDNLPKRTGKRKASTDLGNAKRTRK